MNAVHEGSVSLWMGTAEIPQPAALADDCSADVVVIGSGIAGLSIAYELSNLGENVLVLDRGEIGGGMTSRTSAHLTTNIDDLFQELIRMRGETEARSYYLARVAAVDRIEEIQATERISCDFARVDGYLFPAKSGDEKTLEAELDACRRIRFRGVKWADTPIPDAGVGRSLVFRDQARFHPRKYLAGLVRAIERSGGSLYSNTAVASVEDSTEGVAVKTAAGNTVRARAAVIATNSPITNWLAVHSKQAPYRTYVIAGKMPRHAVPDALYWDTLDPYHYVRLQPAAGKSDWLLVGGEDHKTGSADDIETRLKKLEAWARSFVPALEEIEYRWSGQVLDPVDYLPYIGLNPGNASVFVHTGDSGEGLTNGVIGSLVLRDLIRAKKNRGSAMFSPGRVTAKAATRFLSENVSVVENLAGYVTRGEIRSFDALKRGAGAIIRRGTSKIAAYRDKAGKLHLRSAACTHSGCLLHWNAFETCWDCTCHGSHFSVDGTVLNAPAVAALAEVDDPERPSKSQAEKRPRAPTG